MSVDRDALVRAYKETPRPAGIWAVRNVMSGFVLLGSTVDLPAMLNRQRFTLESGSHPNQVLQRDYDELGAEAFEIDALDTLEQPEDPSVDIAEELAALEAMWRTRLASEGVGDYGPAARRA